MVRYVRPAKRSLTPLFYGENTPIAGKFDLKLPDQLKAKRETAIKHLPQFLIAKLTSLSVINMQLA